jgi:hypothetical protein
LGTSESKLISSNGVIASKIVKAHGVFTLGKALRVVGLYQNLGSLKQALIVIKLKPHPQAFTVHFVMQYITK